MDEQAESGKIQSLDQHMGEEEKEVGDGVVLEQEKQNLEEVVQEEQKKPLKTKIRKVRFSGIPKVPTNQQEDYSLSCVGVLDQSLSNLIQENELKRKCQEIAFDLESGFRNQNRKEMIERRLDGIRQLKKIYMEQQWTLYDELMVSHKQFCSEGKKIFKKQKIADESNRSSDQQPPNEIVINSDEKRSINSSRQLYSDCLEKSQDFSDIPRFDDMERFILQNNQQINTEQVLSSIDTSKSQFQDKIAQILQLEQQIGSAWCRQFAEHDAIAGLISKENIYYIRRTYIIIGRHTKNEDGMVDIDLCDGKISRRQADIELLKTGKFQLTNIGRREMIVDNKLVMRGTSIPLKHQSLIEVGGIELLFIVNQVALDKVQIRNSKQIQKS